MEQRVDSRPTEAIPPPPPDCLTVWIGKPMAESTAGTRLTTSVYAADTRSTARQ